MKTRFLILAFVVLAAVSAFAHPPVSVVVDARGNAYYSDLVQVWKVAPDGTKSVAVAGVHTHELYMDAQGNLYGEHVYFVDGRNDRWGHYVWRRTPSGQVEKVIPDRRGFPQNSYGFARDAAGNMYWTNREKGRIEKRLPNGEVRVVAAELKGLSWHMTATPRGTLFVMDGGDLVRVTPDGRVTRLARNLGYPTAPRREVHVRHAVMGLWTDRFENVYAAAYSDGSVKKVTPDGKVTVIARSQGDWSPTGGAFAPNGDLLLLETSFTNEMRLRRLKPR